MQMQCLEKYIKKVKQLGFNTKQLSFPKHKKKYKNLNKRIKIIQIKN